MNRFSRRGAALVCVALFMVPASAILAAGFVRARLFSPPATPLLEDRDGGFLSEGEREYKALGYWDVQAPLNPNMALCITQIEDRRFFEHLGVDIRALARSVSNNASGKPRQGASTIAMQVASLEYPARRTLLSKAMEASTALFLVLRHGHEKVLDHYLKILPQGNQIFGVAYAARRFFRKPVADLSLAECALLASLPKAPGQMNLFSVKGLESAKTRAGLVLKLLMERGKITREEWADADTQLRGIARLERELRPAESYHYILRTLDEEEKRVGAKSYAQALTASLDPAIQDFASKLAAKALRDNEHFDAGNCAIIVTDRKNGEILAYVGSVDFYDTSSAGAINYAVTPRSSGSILKPFLFAYGLDTGRFTPASLLADLPFSVLSPEGEYHAADFDDDFLGPMLYRRALSNSRNVPALRVLEGVGMDNFYGLARRLGLAGGNEEASYYGYGLAIGGLYVTLENLVAAYGSLANDGRPYTLAWTKASRDPDAGSTLPDGQERFFSAYAAREIGLFLSDDTARFPSFPRMGAMEFAFPVAIKTGTSQGYRDAWTVAWTDKYIIGLWIGNPDNLPMNRVAGIVSASYAAQMLHFLHPDQNRGVDMVSFPRPAGTRAVSLCALSGKASGPDCPEQVVEQFLPGAEPRGTCDFHRRIPVDNLTEALATQDTPASRIVLRSFTILPPEYALWGSRRGFSEPPPGHDGRMKPILAMQYPKPGGKYVLDPASPARFQTIPLQVTVSPRVDEVQWWVDGKAFARKPYPYAARLPLVPGPHSIGVSLAGEGAPENTIGILVE